MIYRFSIVTIFDRMLGLHLRKTSKNTLTETTQKSNSADESFHWLPSVFVDNANSDLLRNNLLTPLLLKLIF